MFIINEHLLPLLNKTNGFHSKYGISLVKYLKMHLKNYEKKGEEVMGLFKQ